MTHPTHLQRMPLPMPRTRLATIGVAVTVGLAACGGSSDGPGAEAGEEAVATQIELPAAILGEAPAPVGEDLGYFAENSSTVGYLSVPDGPGPFPAVILIHEWNGLVDRVRQVADALAEEGYVALAADLYAGRTGTSSEENMALVRETRDDMETVIRNLDAAASYLRGRPDVTGKIAAMGWCFGGGIALSYGLGGDAHEGTAIFYGSLLDDPERLAALDHEVYGTFARLDQNPSPESVEGFQAALDAAGIPNDVHVYDGVNHGFWLRVDQDPDTRAAPAADAWARLKAYLDRTLSP
jgi:carboxymethylenebutenolidase